MTLGTSKRAQVSATYDEMFSDGGFEGVFDLPYRHSCYLPMYKAVVAELRKRDLWSILEVGCGSGSLAHLLFDLGGYRYRGFDFSKVAVEKAAQRTGKSDVFFVSDALNSDNYRNIDACIVCTEVLEHIPNDLELVSKWPSGVSCICSVPNFDSKYHERFFASDDEVSERYGKLIAIDQISRIKKPVLADISPRNLFRQVRWNRYRPRRLLDLLGFGNFDRVGGWYIFSGKRR